MAARFTTQAVVFLTAFIVSAMSFSMMVSAQECTPADITLSSQVEVDNFQTNHGPCDRVTGEFKIEGDDISILSGLSELTEVRYLKIWNNPQLESLAGLGALTYAGKLHIYNNPSLADLQGVTVLNELEICGFRAMRVWSTCRAWGPWNAWGT